MRRRQNPVSFFRDYNFGLVTIVRNLMIITPIFFINKLGVPGNAAFFAILFLMVSQSAENTVKALSLMFLVIVGNTALVNTGSSIFSAGKFLFLFVACTRLLYCVLQTGHSVHRLVILKPLALFCFISFLLALGGGYFVLISTLKLVSYLVGMICIFAAVEAMQTRPHKLDSWFFSYVIFILLLGVLTWLVGIGFNSKTEFAYFDRLFNGPFYHPQTLGPASAIIIIWLSGFGFLTRYRLRSWALVMIPFFLVFLYLSSSRTSLLAIILAALTFVLVRGFMRGYAKKLWTRLMNRGVMIAVMLGIGLVGIELVSPNSILGPTRNFVIKSGSDEAQLQADEIMLSRQSLIDMMTANNMEDPWTGIGFGTSTRPGFGSGGGLLKATTEKGILPIAIVEETGIIGTFFFVVFLISVFVYLIRDRNIVGLMGFSAMLGINLTEMNLFSFGGHGGFLWICVMVCMLLMPATRPPQRITTPYYLHYPKPPRAVERLI